MSARKKDVARAALDADTLCEIFDRFAADATRDFPQIAGRFAILDVASRDYHGDIDVKKSGFDDDTGFAKYLSETSQEYSESATSRAKRKSEDGLLLIVFNGAAAVMRDPVRDITKTLDHELGHLVAQGGLGGGKDSAGSNFRECIADIFACLRDMQRNGVDSPLLDRLAWHRAIQLVRRDGGDHFTTFALQKLAEVKDRIDFDRLTPAQMGKLAWNIASEAALPQSTLERLAKKMKPLEKENGVTTKIEDRLLAAAEILRTEKDATTAKALLAYLSPYIDSGKGFDGKALDLSGDKWDTVRKTVAEQRAKIASSGVLYGMPIKAQASGTVIPFKKKH